VSGRRARAANELTHLGAWIREQLASETADPREALGQTAEDIVRIARGLAASRPAPERDPDTEQWLRLQLEQSRPRQLPRSRREPVRRDDLAAIRQIAALPDGRTSETVARWLRESRDGRTAHRAPEPAHSPGKGDDPRTPGDTM
jgi:hypothetical protein